MKTRLFNWGSLFLLAFLFMGTTLIGQQAKIDSLEHVLKTRADDHSATMNALLELSEMFRKRDPARALHLAEKAHTIAIKWRNAIAVARAMNIQGFLALDSEQHTTAWTRFQSALRISKTAKSVSGEADALRGMGFVSRQRGNREDYIRYLNEALKLSEAHHYYKGVGFSHYSLAFEMSDDEAITRFQRSCEAFKAADNRGMLGLSRYQLGARYLEREQNDSAYRVLCDALPYLAETENNSVLANCHTKAGIACFNRGHDSKAHQHFEQALTLFSGLHDSLGITGSLINIAHALRRLGRSQQALKQYSIGLNLAERNRYTGYAINALEGLGKLYKSRGEIDRAHTLELRRCVLLEESAKTNHQYSEQLIALYYDIGRYHIGIGQSDSALLNYQKGLMHCERSRRNLYAPELNAAIGDIHTARGERTRALEKYQAGYTHASTANNPAMQAQLASRIGKHYFDQHRIGEALDWYQRSLTYSRSIETPSGVIEAICRLAELYRIIGMQQKAIDRYNEALLIAERSAQLLWRSDIFRGLAAVYRDFGYCIEAMNCIDSSIAINLVAGRKSSLAADYNMKGLVYHQQQIPAQAITYYRMARDLSVEIGDKRGAAAAVINIGICHYELQQYNEANDHLVEGLSLAKTSGDMTWQRNAYHALSNTASAILNFEQAYRYHVLFASLNDSLDSISDRDRVASMTEQFDSEIKTQRIALLERERSLNEAELARQQEVSRRHELESLHERQHARLLARQIEISRMALHQRNTDLALANIQLQLERKEKRLREQSITFLSREKQFRTQQATAANTMRNVLALTLFLLLIISYLTFKRIRAKKVEAALRAEAAEIRELAASTELERKESELQKLYTSRMIEVEEQERRRLAGELHDGLGQELLVIENQAELGLLDNNLLSARESLARIAERAKSIIVEVRRVSRNLRPVQLERAGLTETLRDTLHRIEASTGMNIHAHIDNIDGCFSQQKEIHVFRIVQESINNILRHSHAHAASVSVSRVDSDVCLRIKDNGIGFDVSALTIQHDSELGFGLHGMRERVTMLGGTISISSNPGQGTTIDVRLPLPVEIEHKSEVPELA